MIHTVPDLKYYPIFAKWFDRCKTFQKYKDDPKGYIATQGERVNEANCIYMVYMYIVFLYRIIIDLDYINRTIQLKFGWCVFYI